MHPNVHCYRTVAKTWKQPKCPLTEEWIKKVWNLYTMDYYSAIKKNEIVPFAATWMDLEIVILSEVIREGRISHDIAYIWNVKKMNLSIINLLLTSELIYKIETDSQT